LPILKELEQTNEKLLKEKNNLSIVMKIDNELTDDVVKGNNVESILEIVEKEIKKPVVVEDLYHQVVLLKGITEDQYQPIKNEFQCFLKKRGPIKKTIEIDHSQYTRLIAPIYVQEKIVGYCSFFNEKENKIINEIDSMIIGRLSAMCSVVLLNEKIQLESSERIKGYFLEEIINGKYQTEQEIMKKAIFINLDFTEGYYAIYLQYKLKKSHYKYDHSFHNEMFETVAKYMSNKEINVLIGQKTDSLLFLLPQKQLGEKKIEHFIYSFLFYLRKRLENAFWFAGISSLHSKVLEANCAINEAQTANKLSSCENPVTTFSELGILGVLINEENKLVIRQIAELTLGKLYKDLDQNKVDLIETLYTFLTNGGSFDQTAEQLAISISGLRYRLTKITNLLGDDFREPEKRFQLLLTLKALRIVEDEWMEIKC
jgi:sugar diacid utilization regulator